MEIKFSSDEDLPLKKILELHEAIMQWLLDLLPMTAASTFRKLSYLVVCTNSAG